MAKSLDQIYNEIEQQKIQRQIQQAQYERNKLEESERSRLEYLKRNKMFESLSNANSSSSAGAGGNGEIEYISYIDTIWIYPQIDIDTTISIAPGLSPSVSFTINGNIISFPTFTDLTNFYEAMYQQSALSQPLGNVGYSLGVGTITRARRNSRLYLKLDSGLVIAKLTLMRQITNQSDLPTGGDSPDGTIGWGLIYCDWDQDGVQDSTSDVPPSNLLDPLRFKINR